MKKRLFKLELQFPDGNTQIDEGDALVAALLKQSHPNGVTLRICGPISTHQLLYIRDIMVRDISRIINESIENHPTKSEKVKAMDRMLKMAADEILVSVINGEDTDESHECVDCGKCKGEDERGLESIGDIMKRIMGSSLRGDSKKGVGSLH